MDGMMFVQIEDITLHVRECDWVHGRIIADAWTGQDTTRMRPLLRRLSDRALSPYAVSQDGGATLHCTGYLTSYQCDDSPDQQVLRHTITLTLSGPVWREDDTPVEGFNALGALVEP